MIYLDHAATTKPCPAAVDALLRCLSTHYGNPSSLHRFGVEAQREVEQARAILAAVLGCTSQEVGTNIWKTKKEISCQCCGARFCAEYHAIFAGFRL